MPGKIRLCGPRTPGERNGRLAGVVPGFIPLFCAREGGALCALLLTGPFLRLAALGILLISPHLISFRYVTHFVPADSCLSMIHLPGLLHSGSL